MRFSGPIMPSIQRNEDDYKRELFRISSVQQPYTKDGYRFIAERIVPFSADGRGDTGRNKRQVVYYE